MACNCKNAKKIDRINGSLKEFMEEEKIGLLTMVIGKIVLWLKELIVILAVIVATPIITVKVLIDFIFKGGVKLTVPKFLREE